MSKKYKVSYDYHDLFEIEIADGAAGDIKEMVEFWLRDDEPETQEEYTACFLKDLAKFYLREGRIPNDDEGWVDLTPENGFTITNKDPFSFEDDQIEIERL